MKYTHIRNATALIEYGGKTLLIDPYLGDKASGWSFSEGTNKSPTVDLPLSAEEVVSRADAILLTHLHEDHFDEKARSLVPRDMQIFCAVPFLNEVRLRGFSRVTPIQLAFEWEGINFSPKFAQHGPLELLQRMGLVVGYVLSSPSEPKLYLAADTILTDYVKDVIISETPDVVVVNAGGAYLFGKYGPIIMDEPQVADVLEFSGVAKVVAVHLEAVDHGRVTRESLRSHIARSVPWALPRLSIPTDGQTLTF